MPHRAALFLDRDGVIIEDMDYLDDPARVVLLPGAGAAIARVNQATIPVVVVSNQSGVARGYFPESRIHDIHMRLNELLAVHHAHIDRYYYCPHHPQAAVPAYRVTCRCRKPEPGMLLQAERDLDLDLVRSYLVGDKQSDADAAARAGCGAILVQTGYGEKTTLGEVKIVADVAAAVEWCLPLMIWK